MRAKTFDDDRQIEVEIVSGPSSTGLCRVVHGQRALARHVNQLEPLDDEARKLLGK